MRSTSPFASSTRSGSHEHDSVLGLADDVLELVAEQADVERVHDGTSRGDAKDQLDVPVGVAGERRDAVAGLDAERGQRGPQARRAVGHLRPAQHRVAVRRGRHDAARPARPPQHHLDRQRDVLHQPLHPRAEASCGRTSTAAGYGGRGSRTARSSVKFLSLSVNNLHTRPARRPISPPSTAAVRRRTLQRMIDVDRIRAIDVHTHAEVAADGHDPMPPELREASAKYFHSGEGLPTADRRRRLLPRAQHGGGRVHG